MPSFEQIPKKIKWLIALTIIVFISVFTTKSILFNFRNQDIIINRVASHFFEFNQIFVDLDDRLDPMQVLIKNDNQIVYINGRQRGKIKQDYGGRSLNVYYRKQFIGEIQSFNTNNWFVNDYYIHLSQKENSIQLDFEIDGPSQPNVP